MRRFIRFFVAMTFTGLIWWMPISAHAQRADDCPRIEVDDAADVRSTDTVIFNVRHVPRDARSKFSYTWTVSAGEIVTGQGTTTIIVDLAGVRTVGAEVKVEIGGLTGSCPKVASYTLKPVPGCGRALDVYGNIDFEDEKARLDNFAIELQNDSTAQGYLICYGGKVGRATEAQRRCDRAKDYMAERRRIERSRLVTVDGGFKENLTVELWVVPQGAHPPTTSPTVDPNEVQIINDGEAVEPSRHH